MAKKTYVRTSPVVHAYTSVGTKNYTNSKSVTVKKTSVLLKAGKTYKIKAGVTKLQKGKKLMPTGHASVLRYVSGNKKVATVSKSGKIKAKSKGSCKVYVIAVNGARKTSWRYVAAGTQKIGCRSSKYSVRNILEDWTRYRRV